MPSVSATRSSSARSRKKIAIASAATWPSESPPPAIPSTRKAISSAGQRFAVALAPDQLLRDHGRSATKRSISGPSRSAPSLATRSVCSWLSSSPPIPSARLVTAEIAATRRPA